MIAIKNGKVVTVTDKTFEHGTVLIEDGKILAVGENIEIPSDAQVIDASGCYSGTDRLPYSYLQLQ